MKATILYHQYLIKTNNNNIMKKLILFILTICISAHTIAQIKRNTETLLSSLNVKKVIVKMSKASYTRGSNEQEIYSPIQILEQELIDGYPVKTLNFYNTNGLLKDKTTIKYDSAHREIEIISVNASSINKHNTGIENIQKYSYNAEGNITSSSNEYGGNSSLGTYSYKYNEKKQVVEKTIIEGRSNYKLFFYYNKKGDLIKINNGTKQDKGTWFDYEYYKKTDKIKQKSKNTIGYTWKYDEKGQLIAEFKPGKSYYYTYDDNDRITEYTESMQSGTFVTTIKFNYNLNGILISESIFDGKLANGAYKYYTEKLKEYTYSDNKLIKDVTVYRKRKTDETEKLIFQKYIYEYSF